MASSPTLLIVDDTKTNIDVLVQILGREYRLGVTLSGKDALKYVQKTLPDLILLDIIMPEMDGFQVCRKLKALDKTKDIPIIFITAVDNADHRARCFDHGGVDYITKPFSADEVRQKVRRHLAGR